MVYEVEEDELVPLSNSWGSIPKIEILDPAKVTNVFFLLVVNITFYYIKHKDICIVIE